MIDRMSRGDGRYSAVAIVLHWFIAAAILFQLVLGSWMRELPPASAAQFSAYQFHKSVGIVILVLSLGRLGWRLTHHPPPLLLGMPRWKALAAKAAHAALYGLMIGLPLTGWAMVSASPWNLPTVLFGAVSWPHLPVLPTLENKAEAETILKGAHSLLAGFAQFLIVLHVAAALLHQFVWRDGLLRRMLP